MTRLQHGISGKTALGLVRFGHIQRSGRDDLVISVQQGGDLARLAGVMRGRDQPHSLD